MLYGYYFDPTYVLIVIGMVICMAASAHVNSTFRKYSKYRSNSGLTGAQAAKMILESQGIYDVTIQHIGWIKIISVKHNIVSFLPCHITSLIYFL